MDHSANVVVLPRGSFNIAPIEYHCNLSSKTGHIIQIGAVAEVFLSGVRGLGLIARVELDETERNLVGARAAAALGRPFDFLVKEVEDTWAKTKPMEAIAYFAKKSNGSLMYRSPESVKIPPHILAEAASNSPALPAAIRKLLASYLEDKMIEARWETHPPSLKGFQWAEERLAA